MFSRPYIRTLLTLGALIVTLCMLSGARASDRPSLSSQQFLPFIARNAPLPSELEINQSIWSESVAPEYEWKFGHVTNTSNVPLYSVVLNMPMSGYTCFETDPCHSDTLPPERVYPAFAATLPNQPNPYQTSVRFQYKYYYVFGNISVVDAQRSNPGGQTYDALTVVSVERNPTDRTRVTGVVRNDTERVLEAIRTVVYVPNFCPWQEATVDTRTLAPGEESAFQAASYVFGYPGCRDANLQAVGQGVVQP